MGQVTTRFRAGGRGRFFSELTEQLAEAVRILVRYDTPDEKGMTRRDRNEKFGQASPDHEVPEDAIHVWAWFWELSSRRKSGPEALAYADVGEWQRLMRRQVRPEEVEMIMSMDNAFLAEVREEQSMRVERASEASKKGRGRRT